jgi:hypothetical protein
MIKARRCFVPLSPSDWVAKVFLTCDNKIAVQFNHGEKVKKVLPHGPGAYLGHGGVPHVCCLYPGTAGAYGVDLYDLAAVWAYAGEWVHKFLYKKQGYLLVQPPAGCGDCNTNCSIQLKPGAPNNGDAVTITVTVTNTDGGSSGAAPQGSVTISVDGSTLCTQPLPNLDTTGQNWESVSCDWTASCTPGPAHTIAASYTPASGDWASTNCSMNVTVGNCGGIDTSCCPGVQLPETLYATISMASGSCPCLAGTYALNWNQETQAWQSTPQTLCQASQDYLIVACQDEQFLLSSGGSVPPFFNDPLTLVSCDPLQLTATNILVAMGMTCLGYVNVTVTP